MSLDYGDELGALTDGVRRAWDGYLAEHGVTVPDLIESAVQAAWREWLAEHTDEIVAAIARGAT